jgi:class 3 adenylate cyclase
MNFFTKILSMRSRILVMLLAVSILSSVVLIVIGYLSGQKAIKESVFNQMTSIRSIKSYQLESYFRQLNSVITTYAHNESMFEAIHEFKRVYRDLGVSKLTQECNQLLGKHYEDYVVKLANNMEVKDNIDLFYPNTAEACYLQYHYIVENPSKVGNKDAMEFSQTDKSEYAAVHQKYHKTLSDIVKQFGFYDLFLVDLETGNVVYSVFKETDFATNFYTGPYKDSNLADLIRRLKKSGDIDRAQIVDFEPYRPSLGAPAAFMGITLSNSTVTEGALIIQVPVDEINKIMTGNNNWQNDGLGKTGETYLVGDDYKMRSNSRFFYQDTLGFRKAMANNNMPEDEIDKMYRLGSTILNVEIKTNSSISALKGLTNTVLTEDYRREPIISSFQPLKLGDLSWALVCKKDLSEAFKPINDFKRNVVIALCGIILLVSFLSMWLSERFIRPIIQLNDGALKISQGETDFEIKVESKDEIGNLATTFNQMVKNLTNQEKVIKTQSVENEKLLFNFLPEVIAKRYKNGDKNIVEHHSNVTIIFADLVGFNKYLLQLDHREGLEKLNKLVKGFDDAATKLSVEKLRTVGDGYLAACGLHIARLDHQKRAVEFSFEMLHIVHQFNSIHGTKLSLTIGIHSGDIMGGIIGQDKFVYDVWGESVNKACALKDLGLNNEVLVTDDVKQRLIDLYSFEQVDNSMDIFKVRTKG